MRPPSHRPFRPASQPFAPSRLQPRFAEKLRTLQVLFRISPTVPTTVSVDADRLRTACMEMARTDFFP